VGVSEGLIGSYIGIATSRIFEAIFSAFSKSIIILGTNSG